MASEAVATDGAASDGGGFPAGGVFRRITSEGVREPLMAAVASPSAMTHSWLFTGPPGSGRSVAAQVFATALVCPHGGCGECEQCRSAAAGTHPDILWVSTTGSVIPVETVREVIAAAAKMPVVSTWRVVVVEDADRLNEAGSNALLKSVEEPPGHTAFLLCAPSTDPQDLSITLRSRCRHIYIPTPSPAQVEKVLLDDATLGLTPEQAAWAAGVSGGHIGRAKRLASSEVVRAKRAAALSLPRLVYEGPALYRFTSELVRVATEEVASSMEPVEAEERAELERALGVGAKGRGAAKAQRGSAGVVKEMEKEHKNRRTRLVRDSLDLALIDVAGMYRDAMMLAAGAVAGDAPVGGFQHPDKRATSAELARRNSPAALLQCLDAVAACRETLQLNVKPEVALDALAGRLQEACRVA